MKQINRIGLGAMGVFFAPRLSEKLGAGFRVMAEGDRKDRLEQRGVTVNGINYRFPIVTPDTEEEPSDLIIIAVKGYDLLQTLKDIKNQVGPDTILLPVLNGVESEQLTADAYGMEHVLYSFMRISVVMKDGKTDFDPNAGTIHFGDAKNDPEKLSENVLAVKELFDRCGINYKIDPDMIRGIWFKFMCNVAENMTCAVFGIHIANKLGIDIGQTEIDRQEHTLKKLPYENKPSTLQDLEAGKHTEADMFAGTVVRLGKELKVDTPVCEFLYHGLRIIEDRLFGEI